MSILSTRIHVLAHDEKRFRDWVKRKGLKLQDCNYLGSVERMKGIDFNLLSQELVLLPDWFRGRGPEFMEEASRIIGRYCIYRRVNGIKVDHS